MKKTTREWVKKAEQDYVLAKQSRPMPVFAIAAAGSYSIWDNWHGGAALAAVCCANHSREREFSSDCDCHKASCREAARGQGPAAVYWRQVRRWLVKQDLRGDQ